MCTILILFCSLQLRCMELHGCRMPFEVYSKYIMLPLHFFVHPSILPSIPYFSPSMILCTFIYYNSATQQERTHAHAHERMRLYHIIKIQVSLSVCACIIYARARPRTITYNGATEGVWLRLTNIIDITKYGST